jgi:hypothetical protein
MTSGIQRMIEKLRAARARRELEHVFVPPGELLRDVKNHRDVAGMLAFDKWIGNADGRQAIFH